MRTTSGAPRILLVDDETDILDSMRDTLECFLPQAEVVTATSGPAALAALQRERVDLILTDYKMPGMDGLALLRAAEQTAPGVPGVLVTAFPDRRVVNEAARNAGVAGVLTKPFAVDQLMGCIRSALAIDPQGLPPEPG